MIEKEPLERLKEHERHRSQGKRKGSPESNPAERSAIITEKIWFYLT